MAEFEKTRSREREPIPDGLYEMQVRAHEEFHQRQMHGRILVKKGEIITELNRQGRIEFALLSHYFKDTALQNWRVFMHDLQTQSGKHTHQGGLVLFVLAGKGWTVVDGVRHDWEEGDLVLLPIKKGGVEHQHFNAEPGKPCKWIAFINEAIFEEGSSELVQRETSQEFLTQYGNHA